METFCSTGMGERLGSNIRSRKLNGPSPYTHAHTLASPDAKEAARRRERDATFENAPARTLRVRRNAYDRIVRLTSLEQKECQAE